MFKTEYSVWGIAPGEAEERPLFTRHPQSAEPITDKKTAEVLAVIANKRGARSVRIVSVDGALPDFASAIAI